MDGHRADGLWGDLGKDSPSQGGQPHILELSGHLPLQQNSKDWEGECGHARKSHRPPPVWPGLGMIPTLYSDKIESAV